MSEEQDKLEPNFENGPQDDCEEDYLETSSINRVFDYLQTKKGDAAMSKLLSTLESISPAFKIYIEAKAENIKADAKVKEQNPGIEYKKWRALLIVRAVVILISLGVAVYLKMTGNLDSTTTLLIGTIITILATYDRKQQ